MKKVIEIKLDFLQKRNEKLVQENLDLRKKIEILNSQLAVYRSDSQFDMNVDAFTSMDIATKEYE